MDLVYNAVGIVGVLCILAAYFLLQRGALTGSDPRYFWLNLAGAIALGISLLWFWNLPSFLMECAWALISAAGILKQRRKSA